MPERTTPREAVTAEREVSRGHSRPERCTHALVPSLPDEGPNEKENATTTQCGKAMHQMLTQVKLVPESRGEAPRVRHSGEAGRAGVEMYAQALSAVTLSDDLNFSNRRMRTRMSGGVGGE
jgi:hypothetical protein